MRDPPPTVLQPPAPPAEAGTDGGQAEPQPKPKLKKLRVALVLLGLLALALISTVWGMMMAVASDLPDLTNQAEFRASRNSVLLADDKGRTQIAKLTGNEHRILVGESDISPNIKNAVIAIEDKRFYQHKGVDYQGIARALWADVRRKKAVQGGSTITQQFVKNALAAQGHRSVFQKLREAALAYHLERQWSKQKILTQYLNTVYFGNGAYGVESAVRAYFGDGQTKFDPHFRAARTVSVDQAALLAGMIASPSVYDPVQSPRAAQKRRDLVLQRMLDQRFITPEQYQDAIKQTIPAQGDVNPPKPESSQPYFSDWVTQQLVDRFGAGLAFGGGLKITTTLDPALQQAAGQAIRSRLPGAFGLGPSASLVVIENKTGEVKAMVGGDKFDRKPFNLATNGHRQPGSAFKPFILIQALRQGVSPAKVFTSHKKVFPVPHSRDEKFVVSNYENQYAGVRSLASATYASDNSVYAELGLSLGTRKIARLAQDMGIRTKVSSNPAMTLGGLKEGLTPLELAYAYSTIANKGRRVSGSLAASDGPVAIEKVTHRDDTLAENEERGDRVFSERVGETARGLLHGVVVQGTGQRAQVAEWTAGKTGTTESYGDAWFVGFDDQYTVAVWVGYPDRLRFMKTEYHGGPVAGGTFPAEIWHDFMAAALKIREARGGGKKDKGDEPGAPPTLVPQQPAPTQTAPAEPEPMKRPKDSAPEKPRKQPPKTQKPPAQEPAPPPEQPVPPAGGGTDTPAAEP
jgi:penicillin-binding protein 1A